MLEAVHRVVVEGGVHSCQHRLLRVDGSTLWAQTSVQHSDASNGVALIVGLTVNITQAKETEQALRDAEAQARLLVANLRDYGVFMLTIDGRVMTWSPGAQRLKGYTAEEAIGSPLTHFFEEEHKDVPARLLERAELEQQAEHEGWLCA